MLSLRLLSQIVLFFALILAGPVLADSYVGESRFAPQDLILSQEHGFDSVSLPGADRLGIVAGPSLPCVHVNVALPPGALVRSVTVKGIDYAEVKGSFDVIPFPRPRRISNPAISLPFIKDGRIYGTDGLFPGTLVETRGTWDLAGQDFVTLRVMPVQYNPVAGKLFLATKITWEVDYDVQPGYVQKSFNFSERVRAHYLKRLKELAVNPDAVDLPTWNGAGSRVLPPGDWEYVIICPASFESHFQNLATYYSRVGIPTKIVTTDWVTQTYSSGYTGIRSFVKDAVTYWGTIYFLLGGDKADVPCHSRYLSGDSIPNDTYYADYDGNWVIDVYVGRASVGSTAQVDNFVDKTLDYMMNPPAGFGEEVFQMGFDLDSYTKGEKLMKYIKNNWVPAWAAYDSEYDSESGGHVGDCRAYINSGHSVTNHADHCNWDILGIGTRNHGSYFGLSDARNFSNGSQAGIFYTLGCWSAAFDKSDCFLEELANNTKGGSITSMGNSRYGWYVPGSTDDLSFKYDRKFFKGLWQAGRYRAGENFGEAKNDYYPGTDTIYRYVFTELHCLGDPAMPIWTNVPGNYTVDFPATINTGSQSFSVNVKSGGFNSVGVLVCVYKPGEIYQRTTTNTSGNAVFTIDPQAGGDLFVTVSGQNMKTVFGTCVVSSGPPPDLDVELDLDRSSYARGQTIRYRVQVTNNTAAAMSTFVWTNISLPGSGVFPASGYLNGPIGVSLNPSEMKSSILSLPIPLSAPMNSYVFNAFAGPNPAIDDEDHVNFSILW